MTPEIKEAIERAAAENNRSMNAEIISRLENSLVVRRNSSSLDAIATEFTKEMIQAPSALSEQDRRRFHDSYEEAKQTETRAIRRFMDTASELLGKIRKGPGYNP